MDADHYDLLVTTAGPLALGEARLVRLAAGQWYDCPDPQLDPQTTTKELATMARQLRDQHDEVYLVHRRTPDERVHLLACDRDGLFRPVRRAPAEETIDYVRHRLSPLAARR